MIKLIVILIADEFEDYERNRRNSNTSEKEYFKAHDGYTPPACHPAKHAYPPSNHSIPSYNYGAYPYRPSLHPDYFPPYFPSSYQTNPRHPQSSYPTPYQQPPQAFYRETRDHHFHTQSQPAPMYAPFLNPFPFASYKDPRFGNANQLHKRHSHESRYNPPLFLQNNPHMQPTQMPERPHNHDFK